MSICDIYLLTCAVICINIQKGTHQSKHGRVWNDYNCRKCLPCQITRRQEWTGRALLEMKSVAYTYYLTLTYNDLHLPSRQSLSRADLRNFLKRLRKNTGGKFRYLACGEYGEKFGRPHYHLLVFTNTPVDVVVGPCPERKKVHTIHGGFHKAWSLGGIPLGYVDVVPVIGSGDGKRIAAYVAGYVLKKLGKEKMLPGKEPEFQTMSKRSGGIGTKYISNLVKTLKHNGVGPEGYDGVHIEHHLQMIRIDGKLYPLGRTMREHLIRNYTGPGLSDLQKALRAHGRAWKEYIVQDTELARKHRGEQAVLAKHMYEKYLRRRMAQTDVNA